MIVRFIRSICPLSVMRSAGASARLLLNGDGAMVNPIQDTGRHLADFPGCAVWISTALSPRRSLDEGEFKRMGRVDMRLHLSVVFAKKLAKEDIVLFGRSDRQRILSRRGDRAARQASRDRGPQAGAYPTQALRRQVTRRNQIIRRTVRGKVLLPGAARRSPSPLLRTMSFQEGQAPRRHETSKRRALADLTNRFSIRRCFGSMSI